MTYAVTQPGSEPRRYELRELVWLWRTAQLPHDAAFQDEEGQWRPVEQLVEPIIAEENLARKEEANPRRVIPVQRPRRRWLLVGAGIALAVVFSFPILRDLYLQERAGQQEDARAGERERASRIEDFIADKQVVPGMTVEHVLRAWGQPRQIIRSPDSQQEQWIYKKQVVTFERGIVTQLNDPAAVDRSGQGRPASRWLKPVRK